MANLIAREVAMNHTTSQLMMVRGTITNPASNAVGTHSQNSQRCHGSSITNGHAYKSSKAQIYEKMLFQ